MTSNSISRMTTRVGLIADTHEATNPSSLIDLLAAERCDVNLHLGDVGGSPMIVNLVRSYKQSDTWYERMTDDQQRRFDQNVARGQRGVRAYLNAMIDDDSRLIDQRENETISSYQQIAEQMRSLKNPHVILGNVDTYWLERERVRSLFDERLPLHTSVCHFQLGSGTLVIWPSTRSDPGARQALASLTGHLIEHLAGESRVLVAGHEQIFRGPLPTVYRRNLATIKAAPITIPHYAPAPNRDCLLSLARALSPDTDLALASGHVHDPAEVLAAGAPYLKRREGIGLEMRLFGPIRDRRTSRLRVRRATARLFPLGIDEVGVVTFSPDNLHFEVIRPAGAGQPPRRIRIG